MILSQFQQYSGRFRFDGGNIQYSFDFALMAANRLEGVE